MHCITDHMILSAASTKFLENRLIEIGYQQENIII